MTTVRKNTLFAALLVAVLSGCGGAEHDNSAAVAANTAARKAAANTNKSLVAPEIKNKVEYQNYYTAQELYDDPSTVLWCSTTWGNNSAPLVTVPVRGKLTSSSVSLFPSTQVKNYASDGSGTYNPELTSVDGMFHGTPPQYRYGFTPGGQYVDFFNMPTFCTTALTSFQRQSTTVTVTVDGAMAKAQKEAEIALEKCKPAATAVGDAAKVQDCPAAAAALQAGLEAGK